MTHDPTTEIVAAILKYLEAHPGASDTMENISRWWLPEGLDSSQANVALAIERLMGDGKLGAFLRPDGTLVFRQRMRSFAECLANFLCLLIVGEPVPFQWPSAFWELRAPRLESDTLVLDARDVRYPRLRGKVSVELSSTFTSVRWRTRLAGAGFRRPLIITDDGYLCGPIVLGRLCCNNEETIRIRAFLEKQRPRDNDEAAPLAVPHGPIRPRGGLSNAATPDT